MAQGKDMSNKNEPTPYIKVGTIDRLRKLGRGTSRIYSCDGVDVAVFQMKPGYIAVADACPHMGASMGRGGRLRNGTLECSWHNWIFDVKTGESPEKAGCLLDIYDVKVEGNDLYLRLRLHPGRDRDKNSTNDEKEDWGKFDPNLHFKKPANDE